MPPACRQPAPARGRDRRCAATQCILYTKLCTRAAESDEPPRPQAPRKARLGPGAEGVTNAGGIFKSAAVAILRQERRLMTTGDITR